MPISQAVPLLRVTDVGRSMAWYRAVLGFVANPFPDAPPHEFAILENGSAQIMLKYACGKVIEPREPYDWDVYLRLENTPFRELYTHLQAAGIVCRRLERMFYNMAEFEIRDPDGYTLCLGQELADMSDLPSPEA